MATYPEAITNGLRTIVCSSLEFSENVFGYLGGGYSNVLKPGSSPNAPVGDVGFAYLAQQAATQRGIYCNKRPDLPDYGLEGGQCPGAFYKVRGIFGYERNLDTGAITEWSFGDAPAQITFVGPVSLTTPRTQRVVGAHNGLGVKILAENFSNGYQQSTSNRTAGPSTSGAGRYTVIGYSGRALALVGNPNNCGDSYFQPTIREGDNNYEIDVTYTNEEGNDITISPSFSFGFLQVTPTLDLTLPFRVELPDLVLNDNSTDLNGTLNFSTGEINFNFGAAPPRLTDDPLPVEPTDEEPVPDTPPPEPHPDDPAIPRIVGAIVRVTNPSGTESTEIFRGGGDPTIWAPDLGTISFLIRAESDSGWTEDLRIKSTRQYIPCPVPFGAVAVRGSPRPGCELEIRSVRREVAIQEFPE